MCNNDEFEIWNPLDHLLSPNIKDINYAVVLLNTELNFNPNCLLNLWMKAKVRITVDGGTEKWLSWLKLHNISLHKVAAPELITGDMDSLSKNVLDEFVSVGDCHVVHTPNQQETDFTKALQELNRFNSLRNQNVDVVYAVAETSGRFDQILANINTLCKAPKILPNVKVFQVASNSLTWILFEGKHVINIPQRLRQKQDWCALIPLTSTNSVTTLGLKWNLTDAKLEYGELVSTSNTYDDSPTVNVQTNDKIIWSMGIESILSISEDEQNT